MDQSLSGGSGAPSRMTRTVICSFREPSAMQKIIARAPKRKFMCYGAVTPPTKKRADLWLRHKASPRPSTFTQKDESHDSA